MQSLSVIQELLRSHGLRPRHRLGQNFLHDKNQLSKLLEAAAVQPGELVLEIGPGTGTLTEELLERGADVIACELDDGLADLVSERFADVLQRVRGAQSGSLRIIRGDALERGRKLNLDVSALLGIEPFKLVANLPYQSASPLMSALLMDYQGCRGMFVTIQKEVAQRLLAAPSTKEYGPLSIIIQALATVRMIGTLSPGCFWPPPEVTSAMVAIVPRDEVDDALRESAARRAFAEFVTGLFTRRRKQLGSVFGRKGIQWPSGINANMRAEALTVEQITALWKHFGAAEIDESV